MQCTEGLRAGLVRIEREAIRVAVMRDVIAISVNEFNVTIHSRVTGVSFKIDIEPQIFRHSLKAACRL